MIISLAVCLVALLLLLQLLRQSGTSLGLPLAYVAALLLIHVPGALANVVGSQPSESTELVSEGVKLAAIGAMSFVAGVWAARAGRAARIPTPGPVSERERAVFRIFCLLAGWLFVYGLAWTQRIPSVGAAVNKGGAIWSLGVLLGLRHAVQTKDVRSFVLWMAALSVFPALSLVVDGFLSYGSTAVIIAGAVLAVCARSYGRAVVGIVLAAFVGMTVFVNYFEHRDDIRSRVWGGASLQQRVGILATTAKDFHWFDVNNRADSAALDERLNQNFFVGLSAKRLKDHNVSFLNGRSVWEGLQSLAPRIIWPEKPVFGGSPKIVAEMTGLELSRSTSWGVGNVMEFYINFGVPGVVLGFIGLGWLIGWLDFQATLAERRGEFGKALLFFLPAVALIQPNGSVVELTGGAAAALVGALGWRWLWDQWRANRAAGGRRAGTSLRPAE